MLQLVICHIWRLIISTKLVDYKLVIVEPTACDNELSWKFVMNWHRRGVGDGGRERKATGSCACWGRRGLAASVTDAWDDLLQLKLDQLTIIFIKLEQLISQNARVWGVVAPVACSPRRIGRDGSVDGLPFSWWTEIIYTALSYTVTKTATAFFIMEWGRREAEPQVRNPASYSRRPTAMYLLWLCINCCTMYIHTYSWLTGLSIAAASSSSSSSSLWLSCQQQLSWNHSETVRSVLLSAYNWNSIEYHLISGPVTEPEEQVPSIFQTTLRKAAIQLLQSIRMLSYVGVRNEPHLLPILIPQDAVVVLTTINLPTITMTLCTFCHSTRKWVKLRRSSTTRSREQAILQRSLLPAWITTTLWFDPRVVSSKCGSEWIPLIVICDVGEENWRYVHSTRSWHTFSYPLYIIIFPDLPFITRMVVMISDAFVFFFMSHCSQVTMCPQWFMSVAMEHQICMQQQRNSIIVKSADCSKVYQC